MAASAGVGGRLRRLFGHQAHRWTGPLPRRGHPVVTGFHRHAYSYLPAPDRPRAVAVQRLDPAEKPRNPDGPRRAPDPDGGSPRRRARQPSEAHAPRLSGPPRPPAGGHRRPPDARRFNTPRPPTVMLHGVRVPDGV